MFSISNILQKTRIKLTAKFVGVDEFGNEYYEKNNNRFIVYNGVNEPSKIPPEWHIWLHHTSDLKPSNNTKTKKFFWEKSYTPNLTGTKNSFVTKNTNPRPSYYAWNPTKNTDEKH